MGRDSQAGMGIHSRKILWSTHLDHGRKLRRYDRDPPSGMRYGSLSRYAHLDLFLGRDPALFEISRRYPTGCACRLSRTTQFRISPVDLDIPKQETPAYSPQAAAIEPRKVCHDSKISSIGEGFLEPDLNDKPAKHELGAAAGRFRCFRILRKKMR